jgi:hypothetical protein
LKKIFVLLLITLNTSCANLIQGQEQPVEIVNSKENIYMTTCSGLAETMSTCFEKAKRTCKLGYEILDKKLDNSVHREIKFQCK